MGLTHLASWASVTAFNVGFCLYRYVCTSDHMSQLAQLITRITTGTMCSVSFIEQVYSTVRYGLSEGEGKDVC